MPARQTGGPRPTPLARFLLDRILERGDNPNTFAKRYGINAAGFYRFIKGQTRSLSDPILTKVADGLSMTKGDLLRLAEGSRELSESETEVLARVPEIEGVLLGIDRVYWPAVLRTMVDTGRSMAELVAEDKRPPRRPNRAPGTVVSVAPRRTQRRINPRQPVAA